MRSFLPTPYRRQSGARRRMRQMWSIVQVVALAAATFFLLPLMVRAEPSGDLDIEFESPGGSRTLQCEFTGQSVFPDDTAYCRTRIANGSPLDGTFLVFIEEDSYAVTRCPDVGIPGDVNDDFREDGECVGGPDARIDVLPSDPDFDRFVGFWAFSVTTRPILARSLPFDGDIAYDQRFIETCPKADLAAYDGGPADADRSQMCELGLIRSIQRPGRFTDTGEPTYERQYFLGMTLRDDGTDQTKFRGWDLHFDFTVRFQVPADDPCPGSRVNGVCTVPVYQRV